MATDQMSPRVAVRWATGVDAQRLVRDVVALVAGIDPGPVQHSCPACGSITHGRPLVDADVEISVSYASPLVVVAVSTAGPVGVDVERAGDGVREDLADVVLHADEHGWTREVWVRKEALLKATGWALSTDPRSIRLQGTTVVEGPEPSWLVDLSLPEGYLGALAGLSLRRPEVQAGPLRGATHRTALGAASR